MKRYMVLPVTLMAMLVALSVSANGTGNIKDKSFHHSFHHAKNVHRFDKANGFTEYDFMMKGRYVSAFYDASGQLIETDLSIPFEELPGSAREYIQTEFKNPSITEITRVQYKQSACFKIRLESNGSEYVMAVTPTGEIIVGY